MLLEAELYRNSDPLAQKEQQTTCIRYSNDCVTKFEAHNLQDGAKF